MSSTTYNAHPQGEAAALREALRLALAALRRPLMTAAPSRRTTG